MLPFDKNDHLNESMYIYIMNKLEYYIHKKSPYDDKESEDIKIEYENKGMNIIEIADLHRRTPGSISYKLISLGIISNSTESRGYMEYKNSDLYKEIIALNKEEDREKKKKIIKETKLKKPLENTQSTEIIHLRNEIASLKNDVKEILRLMNALYDFENQ
jgi:hypothetical protein